MNCPFCKLEISNAHGNRIYHPECAYQLKKIRSKKTYAIKSIKSNRYWLSERALKSAWFYNEPDTIHEISTLIENGLDIQNYEYKRTIRGYTVFFFGKFGFYYYNDQNVIICKI